MKKSTLAVNLVLALFLDADELTFWSASLESIAPVFLHPDPSGWDCTIPAVCRSCNGTVVLLSARIFNMKREIVDRLRSCLPSAHFVLLVSPLHEYPHLGELFERKMTHLIVDPFLGGENHLLCAGLIEQTVINLQGKSDWQISSYLRHGTPIHQFAVASSDQKEELIRTITSLIPGNDTGLEMLRERCALLADELFENALYGAPRNRTGQSFYKKGAHRVVALNEGIVFSFGFDGKTLTMEVKDHWGSLSPQIVLDQLARQGEPHVDNDCGRGLYIAWRFSDHFHVRIFPGQKTVVGGKLDLTSDLATIGNGFTVAASPL